MERQVALFDIDRTSYEGYLVKDLVAYQASKGILDPEVKDKIYHEEELHLAGKPYEDMAQDMLAHWANGLRGKRVSDIIGNLKSFFESREGNKFFPFVQESIRFLRNTHDSYFVTAEPQFVAEETTIMHGAAGFISTIFETTTDGLFTGRITSSLAKSGNKKDAIIRLMQKYGRKKSFAFGDSDGDIEMLEGVEYPICVNPNDALSKKATEKGWETKKPEEVVLYIRNVLTKSKS